MDDKKSRIDGDKHDYYSLMADKIGSNGLIKMI
jgi:hypothetical protein